MAQQRKLEKWEIEKLEREIEKMGKWEIRESREHREYREMVTIRDMGKQEITAVGNGADRENREMG